MQLSVRLILVPALVLFGCSDDNGWSDDTGPASDVAHFEGAPPPPDGPPPDGHVPSDTFGPPVTLTLATFNVKDFFDETDDPAHQDDVPSAAEVKTKISKLGQALRQLSADVLALQEVENKPLLDRLNTEELASLGYKHVRLIEGNDVRGIDVALLSRFSVPKAKSHAKDIFKGLDGVTNYGFSRDCLEATVEVSGRQLILLVNHLRATDGSNYTESVNRREAQARRVREIADETLKAHPNAKLAVLGDLNDKPDSKTIQLIRDEAPALVDLLTLVPASERYTHAKSSQLDYVLVSPGLSADLVQGSVKADHSQVYSDLSDHFPVRARFTID